MFKAMIDLKLTLKNYRCFSDRSPAEFSLGQGFTALVGPNNSGKSSLIKFFYETRQLWRNFRSPEFFMSAFRGNTIQAGQPIGTYDHLELFSMDNERPLSLEIYLAPIVGAGATLNKVVFTTDREAFRRGNYGWQSKMEWFPAATGGNPRQSVEKIDVQGRLLNGADRIILDAREMLAFLNAIGDGIYIGPFRNAINTGATDYYDITVGTKFIETWHEWKTGPHKFQNDTITRVTEDIKKIFGFSGLEINASMRLGTLQVNIDGRSFKLQELGSGLAQFIVVFGNVAIRQPGFLFIDEPELNLHPSLQIDFLTTLGSYAGYGVLFATHSVGLARAIGDRIYSLQKDGSVSTCRSFEQTPNYVEFLGEMSFSSFKEMGCERILLVEGVSDVRTIQQFLRKLGKDHRIVILPLGGDQLAKSNMEVELYELTRISSKVSALVDSEREAPGAPEVPHRAAFSQTCGKLGFECLVTEYRAIENYFSDRAVKQGVGGQYAALEPYQKLSSVNAWSKRDNWKIARAMPWEDIEDTDIGRFLMAL